MAKPTKRHLADMLRRGVPLSTALRFPSYAAVDAHIERLVHERVKAKIRAHLDLIPDLTPEHEAAVWARFAIETAAKEQRQEWMTRGKTKVTVTSVSDKPTSGRQFVHPRRARKAA